MARPRKTGLDYFPHDTDTDTDLNFQRYQAVTGLVGYAFYFKILEICFRNGGYCHVSDSETLILLAKQVFLYRIIESETAVSEAEMFQKLLSACFKYSLLDEQEYTKNKIITSNGIKRRFEVVNRKRVLTRGYVVTEAETPVTEENSTQSKVKESKEKESKGKNLRKKFNPEGKDKFQDYVYLSKDELQDLLKYYASKNLTKHDLWEAIGLLDQWFTEKPEMREKRSCDAKALKGWPLKEVVKRKTDQIKLETQQIYKENADGSILKRIN